MADRHAEAVRNGRYVPSGHLPFLCPSLCLRSERPGLSLGSSGVSSHSSQIHLLGFGAVQGNWVASRAGLWQSGFGHNIGGRLLSALEKQLIGTERRVFSTQALFPVSAEPSL